ILQQRTIDPSTYTITDRWMHYDQVGSVMLETDGDGDEAARHWPDAFGLRTGGWSGTSFNGEWLNSAGQSGTMHNTKNYDSDVELVYMFQRWYLPETGTFLSSAPYPQEKEHRFGFAENDPMVYYD